MALLGIMLELTHCLLMEQTRPIILHLHVAYTHIDHS